MQIQEVPRAASAAPVALLPNDPLHARFLGGLLVIWRSMTISRKVAVGSAIVGFFILVGLFGPFFMTIDPNKTSNLFIAPPSAAHLLGTTVVGEDIFSQLVYGTRTSVFWGLGTGLLVTLLSVMVGLVSGYFGGWIDDVLNLLTNVSIVLP
jgi:peptide/nickel transport system permease protein